MPTHPVYLVESEPPATSAGYELLDLVQPEITEVTEEPI